METSLASLRLPRPVDTVFWGGGTPGLLPAADLRRLGQALLLANEGMVPCEWTVEMAPSTVKPDRLEALLELGVTRFSMGVQTFNAKLLESLGRIHTKRQVESALEAFKKFGIINFNIDLIFAIPGQSLQMWESDLKSALAVNPAHISTYCLTFEEDTALWLRLKRGEVVQKEPEDEAAFFEVAESVLRSGGLRPYEISNYSREGMQCQHNLNTWRMEEWIGVGPSAASQYDGRRWTEPPSIDDWLARVEGRGGQPVEEVILDDSLLLQDSLIFGLRMHAGVDLAEVESRFGSIPASTANFIEMLVGEGLALRDSQRLRLTRAGRLVADRIGEELLQC
jgi:oxygen-independent coproporphyrinogen-3 oxidase